MNLLPISNKKLSQRLYQVTRYSRVSIATATAPLFGPRKGRRPSRGASVPPRNWRREKIDQLKKSVMEMKEGKSIPPVTGYAPTTMDGPPPSISQDEFRRETRKLWDGVIDIADKAMSDEAMTRLKMDIINIHQGGLSLGETKAVIMKSLDDIETVSSIDYKRIKDAIRPRASYSFLEHTLKELVSSESLAIVSQAISKPPLEDFEPLAHREEALWLDAIPPFKKREYLEKKSKLFFELQPTRWGTWTGPSMEPTIVGSKGWSIGSPITKESCQDVVVGDVVSCVLARPKCQPKFIGKRVRALAGDIVEFKGKRLIVPSGHMWVVGDNEPVSFDSRHVGAVPLSNLRKRLHLSLTTTPPFLAVLWPKGYAGESAGPFGDQKWLSEDAK